MDNLLPNVLFYQKAIFLNPKCWLIQFSHFLYVLWRKGTDIIQTISWKWILCYLSLQHIYTGSTTSSSASPNEQNDGKAAVGQIIKVPTGFKCSICSHVFSLRGKNVCVWLFFAWSNRGEFFLNVHVSLIWHVLYDGLLLDDRLKEEMHFELLSVHST